MLEINYPEKSILPQLKKLIISGTPKDYILFFKKFNEADIADSILLLSNDEKHTFFKKVNPEIAAEILEELTSEEQINIISLLEPEPEEKV